MESSGSISSSHSEKFPDDQEVSKPSSGCSLSSEVEAPAVGCYDRETERALAEKLASALSNVRAKEILVKQHAKVAEEAVSGWENAENEVANLKLQLENSLQKNSSLENTVNHLDGALKECLRQLRQTREDQEEKIRDALLDKMREWETEKFNLETQVIELESQRDSAKTDLCAPINEELMIQLEITEKEKSELEVELHILSEKLRILAVESELSTKAAETASKQHLKSIKKVAKLEAECRRLHAAATKPCNEPRSLTHVCAESLIDSQSDGGDRMLALDNEPCCSDSWASALIAELDQFKSEKNSAKNISVFPMEIDLMDDFLEMERLAALPVRIQTSPSDDVSYNPEKAIEISTLRLEHDRMVQRTAELEEKLEEMVSEKSELIVLLADTQEKLEIISRQHKEDGMRMLDQQRQLDYFYALKNASEIQIEAAKAKGEVLTTQLGAANLEIQQLCEKVHILESELDKERRSAEKLVIKCKGLEDDLDRRNRKIHMLKSIMLNEKSKIKQEDQFSDAAGKLAECQQTIISLGLQLKSLVIMDEFVLDADVSMHGGSPVLLCEARESILESPPEAIHPWDSSCRKDGDSSYPSSS